MTMLDLDEAKRGAVVPDTTDRRRVFASSGWLGHYKAWDLAATRPHSQNGIVTTTPKYHVKSPP
jgi:hypothetical protein